MGAKAYAACREWLEMPSDGDAIKGQSWVAGQDTVCPLDALGARAGEAGICVCVCGAWATMGDALWGFIEDAATGAIWVHTTRL